MEPTKLKLNSYNQDYICLRVPGGQQRHIYHCSVHMFCGQVIRLLNFAYSAHPLHHYRKSLYRLYSNTNVSPQFWYKLGLRRLLIISSYLFVHGIQQDSAVASCSQDLQMLWEHHINR